MLRGRSIELTAIDTAIEKAVAGSSTCLVMYGEAGIGKTSLLQHARQAARDMEVLSCAGSEFEIDLPFAGLHQVLHPVLAEADALSEAQASLIHGAFGAGTAALGGRFGVATAALELLAQASTSRPLLVVVDDAHWLDPASLEVLGFVARRLAAEPICVLFAARHDEEHVSRLAPLGGLDQISVAALDDDAIAELCSDLAAPHVSVPRPGLVREHSAGNPLAIHELARQDFRGLDGSHLAPASIGSRLRAAFAARVHSLQQDCQLALLVVAAGGSERADVLELAFTHVGIEIGDLAPAESAGIVQRRAGGVDFTHPLLRAAVYHGSSGGLRRRVHAAIAGALRELDNHGGSGRALGHEFLAADGVDEHLAKRLEDAALTAAMRRSYTLATDLMLKSADVSPTGSAVERRYMVAAQYAVPAGRLDEVPALLGNISDADPALKRSAEHLRARAAIWGGHAHDAVPVLLELASGPLPSADESSVLLAEAALARVMVGDRVGAEDIARRALDPSSEDSAGSAPARTMLAFIAALANRTDEAVGLLSSAEPELENRLGEQWPLIAGCVHLAVRDYGRAAASVEQVIATAREGDALEIMPTPLALLAQIEFARGHWQKARLLALEGLGVLDATNTTLGETPRRTCLEALAVIEAGLGNRDECRRLSDEVVSIASATGERMPLAQAHRAMGILELGETRYEQASAHFMTVSAVCTEGGFDDTPFLPWLADLFESHLRSGDVRAAQQELVRMDDQARRTSTSVDQAFLRRSRALMHGGPEVNADLEQAANTFAAGGLPFEAGRAQLYLGESLRRDKQRDTATSWLLRAQTTFGALGAQAWLRRTAAELRALGHQQTPSKTARYGSELTPQELQVALIVAAGASNSDAARRLFLSTKTIEYHLGNAYRKLGVSRRSQLAGVLSAQPDVEAPSLA